VSFATQGGGLDELIVRVRWMVSVVNSTESRVENWGKLPTFARWMRGESMTALMLRQGHVKNYRSYAESPGEIKSTKFHCQPVTLPSFDPPLLCIEDRVYGKTGKLILAMFII